MPDPSAFAYTFDTLSEVTERFLKEKGFERRGLFVQDYGGPVGFRIVTRRPEALDWLIIQNTNAYEIGFTDAWGGLRNALWKKRTPETEQGIAGLLEFGTVKTVYLHGHKRPELISPSRKCGRASFRRSSARDSENFPLAAVSVRPKLRWRFA